MRLRYTLEAVAELDAVLTFIQERDSPGGRNVQRRILGATQMLLTYPMIGRPTRNGRLRRLLASPYPYLIFYQVRDDEIIIHDIRHAARDAFTMPGH